MYIRQTTVESGKVQGYPGTNARITVYKGIPYAAPPVGELRWRAPQPPIPWEGVRKCYEFGPISMQEIPGQDPDNLYSKEWHVDPNILMGEDSLRLNIWTPAHTTKEKLPVFVWIYGGGLQVGYTAEMEFNGERLASRGIVVVTMGYRLNAFGFLAHPDLTRESPETPTNFGFLDQKAAIEWVRRNIENFGGDPGNITIGGQSSGGVSVANHLCAPSLKGLFQKAIIQSSAGGTVRTRCPHTFFNEPMTLEKAEEFGKKFLEEYLGVSSIEEARKLDAAFIRDKVVECKKFFPNTIDGKFVTGDVDSYLFTGNTHPVPVMIGYTSDEMDLGAKGETLEECRKWVRENYGVLAEELLKKWDPDGSVEELKNNSVLNGNEISTRLMAEEWARQGKKVYVYDFGPEMPGDEAGAFHSSDLWFTFETLGQCWRPFDGHHYDLARKMCNYWANFIRSGDPNGKDADGTPMPQWDPYTAGEPKVMEFYDTIQMQENVSEVMQKVVTENLVSYEADWQN